MKENLFCLKKDNLYPAHGGNPQTVVKEFGVRDGDTIDFSASVNPLGPSPKARLVLSRMESLLAEYPDPDSISFCEKVSECLEVPSEWILVTNGSTELIHLLPRLLKKGKSALILNPCYSEYDRAFQLNKICVHSLNYDVEKIFQMDPGEVMSQLRIHPEIEMLVLGNPNNPTGHIWNEDSLSTLIQYCNSQKIILVVDETFIEFCPQADSALKRIENNPYLVVIRSMTKFYGLAGVRLGYGVMHPDVKARLKKYQIPWSVNTIAQLMGIAAFEDRDHAQQTRERVQEQRQYLFSELNDLENIRVFPSHTNYILFHLIDGYAGWAHQLHRNLIKEGLLIRNCGNFDGLDKSYFRVAVRNEKDNQILVSRIKVQLDMEC